MRYSSTFLLISMTTSCSRIYYTEPTDGSTASVSFSNLSPERPDIYIISNCKILPVESKLIEQRNPLAKSRHKILIPADKIISFKYEYNFIISKGTQPVTTEGRLSSRIIIEKTNNVDTCSSLISFKPDKDEHYEVYFGLLDTSCTIKAEKSSTSTTSGRKKLHSIPTTRTTDCIKQ